MKSDVNAAAEPEPKQPSYGFLRILFVIVFFVLALLLGLSMVHHRFFQGEREHPNGSVGQ